VLILKKEINRNVAVIDHHLKTKPCIEDLSLSVYILPSFLWHPLLHSFEGRSFSEFVIARLLILLNY
jgi:hypothetical protein